MKSKSRFSVVLLWSCLLVIGILLTVGPLQGADFGWHLQIGKLFWEQGTTLPTDPFSFTMAGSPWPYKDLLADLILYGAYASLGAWGLWLLKLVALLVIAWGFHRLMTDRQLPTALQIAVITLVWSAILYRVLERPLLFSLVCFALLICQLEKLRLQPDLPDWSGVIRALLPVVLLQWLWVQLHRGAMLGYVMLLGWGLGLLAAYLFQRRSWSSTVLGTPPSRRLLLGVAVALPLSVLLGLLNPSGIHTFTSSLGVVGSQVIRQYSSEWQAISFATFLRHFPFAAMLSITACLGWLFVFARNLRAQRASVLSLWPGCALLLFVVLSTRTIRWIPYLSMVSGLLLIHLCATLVQNSPASLRRLASWPAILLVSVLGAGLVYSQRAEPWKIGEETHLLPAGAVAFAKRHKLRGNVMHAFRFGGYLIWRLWPQCRVILDGRNDMIYPPGRFVSLVKTQADPALFHQIRQRYGVTWVIASNHLEFRSHPFLAQDPAWAMVYWSEAAVMYVQRNKYPQLRSLAYRWIHPLSVDASVYRAVSRWRHDAAKMNQVYQEIQRMLRASPQGIRAHIAITLFYHLRGKHYHAQRNQWAERLRRIAGHRPTIQVFLQRLRL